MKKKKKNLTYPNWLGITAEYPALILGKANAILTHKNIHFAIKYAYRGGVINTINNFYYAPLKHNTTRIVCSRLPVFYVYTG